MATYESKKYGTIPVAATQIADGSVTNAEYQFINSLSSNAQTQITALDTAKLNLTGGTLTGNVTLADNVHAYFGAGQDIDILSDGTVGYIKANDLRLQSSTGENYVTAAVNGAANLFYDNANKLQTTATGVTITGVAAATTVTGDGSGLTALNGSNISSGTVADARISTLTASKLTGALPAIDGSNLTGIDVVPSGTDTVGAIRYFALYAASGGSPNPTTLSPGTEITPATYTNGGSPALYLAIDPGPVGFGYGNSISHAITGKTRTTVSGTWRVLTIGQYTVTTVSSGPNAGNQSSSSNGFLAQRIT